MNRQQEFFKKLIPQHADKTFLVGAGSQDYPNSVVLTAHRAGGGYDWEAIGTDTRTGYAIDYGYISPETLAAAQTSQA